MNSYSKALELSTAAETADRIKAQEQGDGAGEGMLLLLLLQLLLLLLMLLLPLTVSAFPAAFVSDTAAEQAAAHFGRGECMRKLGRLKGAIAAYNAGAELLKDPCCEFLK